MALDIQQRRKRGMLMRRLAKRLAVARKRQARRLANKDRLEKRARRMAIKLVRKVVAGKMGLDYSNLSVSQKMAIDKKVAAKTSVVNRIAKRIMPKVRQKEIERFRSHNDNKTDK